MSAAKNRAPARKAAKEPQEQSAAAPSPFPPIADYAFLISHGATLGIGGFTDPGCPHAVPRAANQMGNRPYLAMVSPLWGRIWFGSS